MLVTVLVFVTLALKGGFYIYFFQDYLSEPALARFLESIGFNHFISGLNAALHAIGLTEFKWPDDAPTSAFGLFIVAVGMILERRRWRRGAPDAITPYPKLDLNDPHARKSVLP